MLDKIKQFFDTQISPLVNTDPQSHEKALQQATAVLLLEMVRVDGHVSTTEEQTVRQVVTEYFGLTEMQTAELLAFANDELDRAACIQSFTRLLNEILSQDDKLRIIEMLWRIAYADGRLDKYEEHYLRKINELLYVPHTAFIRMKLRVQEGFASP